MDDVKLKEKKEEKEEKDKKAQESIKIPTF